MDLNSIIIAMWRVTATWLAMGGVCLLRAEPMDAAGSDWWETSLSSNPNVPGTQLTWADCVRLATRENPDLQASREAVLNSDAVHMGAYSALYPQISAAFTDTRAYAGPYLNAPKDYSTAYEAELTLTQLIFDGFATKGRIDQAKAQLNLAFANLDNEKAIVSFNLKSAFAQLIYAQKLVKISQDVIDIRQSAARLVKLLYEGGSEDKGNMLLSQANLDVAIYNLDQAVRERDLSGIQLCVYIGRELPAPILAEGELITGPLSVQPDFDKLALVTPLHDQRQAQVEAAAAGITIANSGWYPTVSASVSGYRTGAGFEPRENNWSAGVEASFPIFEGGATYFNVKAANALLREALENLRSGTDDAALTLAEMFKGMVDAEDNVRIQQELLDATALRYKIAEADYRNGLMSFEDFNTITNDYVSQQLTLLSAQFNAVIAEADWEEARGLGAIP